MPNVKKIRALNLPGTPWATSACCGRPLPLPFTPKAYVSETVVRVLQSVRGLIHTVLRFFNWFNESCSHYLLHNYRLYATFVALSG